MNAVKFLFAAYIATWVIHAFYLGTLVRRFGKIEMAAEPVYNGRVNLRGLDSLPLSVG